MSSGASLPLELVATVLDYADIQQLIVVSHVCALWRSVARVHPVFWRSVSLNKLSLPAARLFEARLRASRGKIGINVSIHVETMPADGLSLLGSIALPAVERNLFRTAHLRLSLPEHGLTEAMKFLGHPAPMLRQLALTLTEGYTFFIAPRTIERFFYGSAPKLREIELRDVRIVSNDNPYALFRGIESVRMVSSASVHLPGLFSQFPSLRHLEIMFSFFSDPANITHISCWWNTVYSQHTVSALLGVFDAGHIALSLLDNRGVDSRCDFGVMFSCADSAREHTRTFYVAEEEDEMPSCLAHLEALLLPPEIRARVSRMRILAPPAALISLVGELPACEVLEIEFDDGRLPAASNGHFVHLPALRTVELTTSNAAQVTVSRDDLFALLHSIVGAPSTPLEIQQGNVHILGHTAHLPVLFD
ncbi:hypothetical protein AURDEDRAFT_164581 [Auricularia subglabra TFB-10046 SS5]|nr:hypothetical protein AURDEDRAFT_164581 [Auricularia subglabra TFB-10046 SS5]